MKISSVRWLSFTTNLIYHQSRGKIVYTQVLLHPNYKIEKVSSISIVKSFELHEIEAS